MFKHGQRTAYKLQILTAFAQSEPGAEVRFKLSAASKLMGAKTPCAFSLPAGPQFSCPGATPTCSSCYAQTGRFAMMPGIHRLLTDNWNRLRWYEANANVRGAASELSALINTSIFRLNESGDFHSQFAVDVWTEVVRRNPSVWFWGYTRSFTLNFKGMTAHANMRLWASSDGDNAAAARRFAKRLGLGRAFGPWSAERPKPKNAVVCPSTLDGHRVGKTREYGVDKACQRCRSCLPKFGGRMSESLNRDMVFLAHGSANTVLAARATEKKREKEAA